MADVFISYPREEQERVRQLVEAFERRGRQVWVDWGNIPPSAEWQAEIIAGIEGADVFVALLTRASVNSAACADELAHAVSDNKRMVPIAVEQLEGHEVPPELARINWLWWRAGDDVEAICDALIRAIDIELDWVRAHTRLLVRAREWERGGREASLLLRGRDLTAMEHWLAGKHVDPSTTPEQIQYIVHSRNSATRRQRTLAGAITLALVITAALAVIAEIMRREADKQAAISLTRQLAAESTLVRERNVDQLPYATLLASEAVKRTIARGVRVPEPEQALRAALDALPGQRLAIADVASVGVAWDGDRFFTIDSAGVPRLHVLHDEGVRELAHAGEKVTLSAFSSAGTHLVTATASGTVRLWNARSFDSLSTQKVDAPITALAVTYEAFAAAAGQTVTVWEVPTGREIASLHVGETVAILALVHGPDRQPAVALAAPAGKVTIILVSTRKVSAVLDVPSGVRSIQASPDGQSLIVEEQHPHTVVFEQEEGTMQIPTPEGRTLRVWKVDDWKEVVIQADGPGPEQGRHVSRARVAIDPRSRWMAAGSVYRSAQIWDMATGRRVSWFDDVDFVSALRFTEDGRLLTGTENGTVSIWALGPQSRDGNFGLVRVSTFKTTGPVRELSVDPSGLTVAVHGGSTLSLWRIGQEILTIPERDAYDVTFAGGQLSLMSGTFRTVADANRGIVLTREKAEPPRRRAGPTATSQDGRLVASRQGTRDIEVKEAPSGSLLSRVSASADVDAILLSPDGRWLIADMDEEDGISMWEAATGRTVVGPLRYFDDYEIAFTPDGAWVAVNDGTRKVFIHSLPEGRLIQTLEHPGASFGRLEFSAGGAWLVTTALVHDDSRDYTARVWRTNGWTRVDFVDDTATAARISADERLIVAGYRDGRMALFDANTGAALITSIVHEAAVTQLSLSADGRWLAAAAGDRVQVFDTQTRSEIARLTTKGDVGSMLFSEDGHSLVTAAFAATQVWRLRPDELLTEACRRLQRDLTASEWQAAFGDTPPQPTCRR